MTTVKEEELCICMTDTSPEERREWLIKACAAAMRWYAMNPHKRHEDNEHMVVLTELLQELSTIR